MVMFNPKSRPWYDYLLNYNYNPHAVFAGGECNTADLLWTAAAQGSSCQPKPAQMLDMIAEQRNFGESCGLSKQRPPRMGCEVVKLVQQLLQACSFYISFTLPFATT